MSTSKVPGYENFWRMTDIGQKIYKRLEKAGLAPLFTTKDAAGNYVTDSSGQLRFTGILLHINALEGK